MNLIKFISHNVSIHLCSYMVTCYHGCTSRRICVDLELPIWFHPISVLYLFHFIVITGTYVHVCAFALAKWCNALLLNICPFRLQIPPPLCYVLLEHLAMNTW